MTANQLLAWRQSLRLTQIEAARKLGVLVSTYREWEQGKRRKPHALLDLACQWVTLQERQTFGRLDG